MNSASSRNRDCRAKSLFVGSRSRTCRRLDRRLPVRRRRDHQPHDVLHVPLRAGTRRQPVEQFRVRRQFALRAGLLQRPRDAVAEEELPEPVHGDARRQRVLRRQRSTSRGRAACSARPSSRQAAGGSRACSASSPGRESSSQLPRGRMRTVRGGPLVVISTRGKRVLELGLRASIAAASASRSAFRSGALSRANAASRSMSASRRASRLLRQDRLHVGRD